VEFVKRWAVREQAVPAVIALAWLMAKFGALLELQPTGEIAELFDAVLQAPLGEGIH